MIKISDAELEVMKVIWDKEKVTSVEIIQGLSGVTWNYNTIRTLIKRLLVKGAIEIIKKEGKTYTYRPTIAKEDYKIDVLRKLLKKLYRDSFSELVLQYCESGEVTESEMKQIAKEMNNIANQK